MKESEANESLRQPDMKRIRLTCQVDLGADCEKQRRLLKDMVVIISDKAKGSREMRSQHF